MQALLLLEAPDKGTEIGIPRTAHQGCQLLGQPFPRAAGGPLVHQSLAARRNPPQQDKIARPITVELLQGQQLLPVAEVDERIVNLSRFPVFFPEKRDFFLQDTDVFRFGGIGRNPLPYFSRRIGIGPEGEPLDIIRGGISGQALIDRLVDLFDIDV